MLKQLSYAAALLGIATQTSAATPGDLCAWSLRALAQTTGSSRCFVAPGFRR
jgi:hypothetical protein